MSGAPLLDLASSFEFQGPTRNAVSPQGLGGQLVQAHLHEVTYETIIGLNNIGPLTGALDMAEEGTEQPPWSSPWKEIGMTSLGDRGGRCSLQGEGRRAHWHF